MRNSQTGRKRCEIRFSKIQREEGRLSDHGFDHCFTRFSKCKTFIYNYSNILFCEQDYNWLTTDTLILLINSIGGRYFNARSLCGPEILDSVLYYVDPGVNTNYTVMNAIRLVEVLDPCNTIHEMLFQRESLTEIVTDFKKVEGNPKFEEHSVKLNIDGHINTWRVHMNYFLQFFEVLIRSDDYACILYGLLKDTDGLNVLKLGLCSDYDMEIVRCTLFVKNLCRHRCRNHDGSEFVSCLTGRSVEKTRSKWPMEVRVSDVPVCEYSMLCKSYFATLTVDCEHTFQPNLLLLH